LITNEKKHIGNLNRPPKARKTTFVLIQKFPRANMSEMPIADLSLLQFDIVSHLRKLLCARLRW